MDILVMFYSFTGRTHYEAKRLSERVGGELYEVWEQRHRSRLSAYLLGPYQARKREFIVIEPIAIQLEEYDKIYMLCPIWGGYPAPAFNAMLREIPMGMEVEIILTSDSGKAKDLEGLKARVEQRGVRVSAISVIKTQDLKKRDKKHRKKRMLEKRMEEKQKISDSGKGAK